MGRDGRLAFSLAAGALAWSALLLAGAFALPAGRESSAGPAGVATRTTTLFESDGWHAVGLLAGIAALVALAVLALHERCARGTRGATTTAWLVVAVLLGFSILAAASVGAFILPGALLLAASARVTPRAAQGR